MLCNKGQSHTLGSNVKIYLVQTVCSACKDSFFLKKNGILVHYDCVFCPRLNSSLWKRLIKFHITHLLWGHPYPLYRTLTLVINPKSFVIKLVGIFLMTRWSLLTQAFVTGQGQHDRHDFCKSYSFCSKYPRKNCKAGSKVSPCVYRTECISRYKLFFTIMHAVMSSDV